MWNGYGYGEYPHIGYKTLTTKEVIQFTAELAEDCAELQQAEFAWGTKLKIKGE